MPAPNALTDEDWDKLRSIYVESDPEIDFSALSEMSEAILGRKVSHDVIKVQSRRGSWRSLRGARWSNRDKDGGDDISREVEDIRKVLYRSIMAAAHSGFFVYGKNIKKSAIEAAVLDIPGVEGVEGISPVLEPSTVNAYMNLLSKSKVDLSKVGGSGKTSLQQAIEIAQREISREET